MKKAITTCSLSKFSLFLIILFNFGSIGYSQNRSVKVDSVYRKNGMQRIANQIHKDGFIIFKDSLRFEEKTFFKEYRTEFGLKTNDQIEFSKSISDEYGFKHSRYFQKHKGYKVEFAEIIVHSKDGIAEKSNGVPVLELDVNTKPEITGKQAIENALNYINASKYAWEETKGNKLGEYPKPELVILPKDDKLGIEKDHLVYKFDVYALNPLYRAYVYVDAQSGEIIFENSRIHNSDAIGSAATLYSGTKTITTEYIFSSYRLRETGRGNGITTLNMKNGTIYSSATDFTDADNNWSSINAGYDAHWGTEMTYDYYLNTFGRDSYDDAGAVIYSYVHYRSGYNNAFWDGGRMTYGDGDGSTKTPFTCIDIIGHEITHAVTEHTANLVYKNESGALNESFSDIFGTCIEFYAKPANANWLLGNEISKTNTPLRNMNNPKAQGQPNTYKGTNWYSGSEDEGGVHTNSGVLNYWFYLLTVGGSGKNDKGTDFGVDGIGMQSSSAIAYRTLTVYLTPSSDYSDARQASIEAACDIFGKCSYAVTQVVNAWNAVGVYGPTTIDSDINVCGNIAEESYFIASNSISASNNCTEGYANVNSGSTVIFRAGNIITLNPGFTANYGCVFKASIYNCNGGGVLKSAKYTMDDYASVTPETIDQSPELIDDLLIYPNPTEGIVNLQFTKPTNSEITLSIYNIAGNLICKETANHDIISVDLSAKPLGIYFVEVVTDNGVFIKELQKK